MKKIKVRPKNSSKKSFNTILNAHFLEDKLFQSNTTSSWNEVKKMLEEQNKNVDRAYTELKDHMSRVEPMLSSYEKDTAFSKSLGEKGKKWGAYVGGVAALIGSWYVIKAFIITIFHK